MASRMKRFLLATLIGLVAGLLIMRLSRRQSMQPADTEGPEPAGDAHGPSG